MWGAKREDVLQTGKGRPFYKVGGSVRETREMTQNRALYNLFKINNWSLHALTIWANSKTVGRKYTGRLSDLRDLGFDIYCNPKSEGTNRLYELRNPEYFPMQWKEKISGAGKDQAAEAVCRADTSHTGERTRSGGQAEAHDGLSVHPFPAPHISNTHQNQLPL